MKKKLLEQVLALYHNRFADSTNNSRRTCRADEYFDIPIGKTPPEKNHSGLASIHKIWRGFLSSIWVIVAFIFSSSSEYLTKTAVEQHNIKNVPDNTVLLSFKLTVGRIAITNGEMTINEATAVNLIIIKSLPFVVPTAEEVVVFHSIAAPMFAQIKANQPENNNLIPLRNTLLPKLMSCELDV